MRLFRKKKDKKPSGFTFEDSLKAEVKLKLYSDRKKEISQLMFDTDNKGKEIPNEAGDMLKTQELATQSLGELGEKHPITAKCAKGWKKLLGDLSDAIRWFGPNHPYTNEVRGLVFEAFATILPRSVRREHTNVEIAMPPAEWFKSSWGMRASRTDSLEEDIVK